MELIFKNERRLCEVDDEVALRSRIAIEQEYFDILSYAHKYGDLMTSFTDNMMNMSMEDQLKQFRVHKQMIDIAIELNKKYGFYDESELVDYD